MGRRVLIVDDEDSILTILDIMLVREGFTTYTASSAEQALEIIQDVGIEKLDLIITDVVMPKMNGYELGLEILDQIPDQPIIFISGFNSSKQLIQLIEQNENLQYQSKPFGFDDIKDKISKIL